MYHLMHVVGLTLLLLSLPSIGEAVRHPIGEDDCHCAVEQHVAVRSGRQVIGTGIDHTQAAKPLEQQAGMGSGIYLASADVERQRQSGATQRQKRETDLILAQVQKKREEDAQRREEEDKRKMAAARKAEQDKLNAIRRAQLEKVESIEMERMRLRNLERIAGLAGATGAATSKGTAQQASGDSASYGSRVSAIVKPNIVFIEDPADHPTTLVEVRAAPDGTIVGRKLLKSSGNKAWDDAVLNAIDKIARLPRDSDGTVPPLLEITFQRRD